MVIIGQILGWIAALLTFLSYQCKDHKKLIFVQTASTVSICLSYLFLDAKSGMMLNIICIIRNLIIYKKDLKIFSYRIWAYILAFVMGVMGVISWQGPMSLLIIVALVANTVFLYFPNVQNLRKSVIVTSSMILIYNAYYNVWGGVVNEMIAITSSAVGIYRYRNTNQRQ